MRTPLVIQDIKNKITLLENPIVIEAVGIYIFNNPLKSKKEIFDCIDAWVYKRNQYMVLGLVKILDLKI